MPANCVKSVKIRPINGDNKKIKKIRHLYARKVIKVFSPRSKDEQFVFTERTCFPGLEMVCLKNRNCLMWLFVHWQTLKATTVHPGGGLPTVEDNAAVKIGFKWQNSTKKKPIQWLRSKLTFLQFFVSFDSKATFEEIFPRQKYYRSKMANNVPTLFSLYSSLPRWPLSCLLHMCQSA